MTFDDLDVIPHAVGFMPDHVHVVVSVPPKIAVAEVVRRLKGAATHAINEKTGDRLHGRFSWQGEYGAISLGEASLSRVISYVENQRQHHAEQRLWQLLERTDEK